MRRGRPAVPQRALFFAGCEGDGERAYVGLLNRFAKLRGLHVWIHAEPLNPGAGDPLALVARAVERHAHRRKQGAIYRLAAVFLDADTTAQSPERAHKAQLVAREAAIQLVWQRPNLEAMLLRHLDGCRDLQPDAAGSLFELRRHWPEYDKRGISTEKLVRRIGYPQIVQAAGVEPELRKFLERVGLV